MTPEREGPGWVLRSHVSTRCPGSNKIEFTFRKRSLGLTSSDCSSVGGIYVPCMAVACPEICHNMMTGTEYQIK